MLDKAFCYICETIGWSLLAISEWICNWNIED